MTRRIASLLLAVAAACSGSSKAEPAAPTPVTTEIEELEAARPVSPLRTERTAGFRAAEQRGQEAYHVEANGLSARYGEGLFVYACAPRPLSGRVRLTTIEPAGQPSVAERTFGGDRRHHRVGGPLVVAGAAAPADCPVRTRVVDATFMMEGDGVPVAPGTRFVVDIWSSGLDDLDDVLFVVEQQVVRRDMTPERWAAYRRAHRAWTDRYLAYLQREVAAGRTTLVDRGDR